MDRYRKRLGLAGIVTGVMALLAFGIGCASSTVNVDKARNSRYDAERAIVLQGVMEAVKVEFPRFDHNQREGWLKTAWYPLKAIKDEGPRNPGYAAPMEGESDMSSGVASSSDQRRRNYQKNQKVLSQDTGKNYFIRFDVFVEGERPWRVRVKGHASELEAGMSPRPLTGDETPYWVASREEALLVSIYQQLRHLAVAAPGAPGAK